MERMKEPRVRCVVEGMLSGNWLSIDEYEDEYRWCLEFGVFARKEGLLSIANPIYREFVQGLLTGCS